MYLQCHPWLLGHYCELEEGRAGLRVGAAQGAWRSSLLMFPAVGSDRGGFGPQVSVWGRLSLHVPSSPLYRQFPSHSRQDENLCWWSLLPGPPV